MPDLFDLLLSSVKGRVDPLARTAAVMLPLVCIVLGSVPIEANYEVIRPSTPAQVDVWQVDLFSC